MRSFINLMMNIVIIVVVEILGAILNIILSTIKTLAMNGEWNFSLTNISFAHLPMGQIIPGFIKPTPMGF